ncbi:MULTISPECIES: phosphate signaling complex protein PhoU [Mammaliicoccus]|jgi:phosphate transport system protein|uniref:Phosphate-specific transport system accessory protein PhoU n=1 Tax=Mammaliicoccus sciuri TaxID=1296 RepID=A0AAJ4SHK6_MAMSC|nr:MULTISPECIES: phosphate signaling complex protein PhoU [Mammaliicoccus]HCW35479.1 phosphate transport system regulatory protein PhoU [Staphylococcus sp.]KTT83498.1 PhoU family transcriptional regulator [Mammaliicoccus sciuri]MBA1396607.1 phosphate signaling complex protein PhoU [Mammaliicoccus sciuri]MBF0719425.1 phosphate signaling complex protein PhoU [Mammaliicoccus sciuri]MBF0774437.1 phosphate signaling complex protein PhoU [Mammaliicoccus sciuri]
MVIREKYEDELNSLINDLFVLGKEVYFMIEQSISVLSDEDRNNARNLIKYDKKINQMEYDINEKVVMLITKQQPIATDLRVMISGLKIASELERMADNSTNIAQIRKRVKITDYFILTRLKTMGKLAMLMLKDLEAAVNDKDILLIKEIIDRDNDIDDLYREINNTTYLIDNDPFISGQAHLAARYLERIGDHITNISESCYYYITGEHYEPIEK